STLKKLIHGKYDHTLLNDHEEFSSTDPYAMLTTEVVAKTVYDKVAAYLTTLANKPVCVQVFVRETPTSYCIYRPKRVELND
ncbi:MAG: 6-carboxytetrahydropterin synthase, partial [Bacillus sp. (in: Bacteria)]|nr:6-carboxytetrahydropterin synthase [Bacillus sp. (in: firmicutes)]